MSKRTFRVLKLGETLHSSSWHVNTVSWLSPMGNDCLCVCLWLFPTGLSKVLPQLYLFSPFLSWNVKCEMLCINLHSLSGSSTTCATFLPLYLCLSFTHWFPCPLALFCTFGPMPAFMYVWSVSARHALNSLLLHNVHRNWAVYMRNSVMKYLACLEG